ncbi:MAG TPA: hypothetical protein VJ577_08480 [Burkholderiaceae bacterium]|nr:hypothetical protein [Burkholderiaceae bacterium]
MDVLNRIIVPTQQLIGRGRLLHIDRFHRLTGLREKSAVSSRNCPYEKELVKATSPRTVIADCDLQRKGITNYRNVHRHFRKLEPIMLSIP